MVRNIILFLGAIVGLFALASCGEDDTVEIPFTGNEKDFPLFEVGNSGIEGTVRFKEREDGAVLVVIQTDGSLSGVHPAHIHENTASETGNILISLSPVTNGVSETLVTEMDNGTAISYEELINLDGHVNVHQSSSDLGTIVAQGDLGDNVLTGEAEFYQLFDADTNAVAVVAFKERMNGTTLAEVEYTGSSSGSNPVHIHSGTASMGSNEIAFSLNEINASGRSATNISQTDAGTDITYQDLINYNGFMDIHTSASNEAMLASGDIGGNEFTGEESVEYHLDQVNNSGVVGVARFYERTNGSFMVILQISETEAGSSHPAHIHHNSVAEGGSVAIPLTNVENSFSITEVNALGNGTPITYNEILTFDGHINVHQSAQDISIYLAQGNIGSNN